MIDIGEGIGNLDAIFRSDKELARMIAVELSIVRDDERAVLEWVSDAGVGFDIGLQQDGQTVPVEVIYRTRECIVRNETSGIEFDLPTNGAYRIYFYRNIWNLRILERIVNEESMRGALVLLSNDPEYWRKPQGEEQKRYDDLRLWDGRKIGDSELGIIGRRDWMEEEGAYEPIQLANRYTIHWRKYSYSDAFELQGPSEFRYVVLDID